MTSVNAPLFEAESPQGFSGRFDGLFFRLAIHCLHMHLKNKQMNK
ncbi:hypothetical protein C4J94_5228 [Pseudomonas sp. R5-89-07]|nr:hypothetical protein C4J94_5228 [Pseudomonas sp. R5-89-07]